MKKLLLYLCLLLFIIPISVPAKINNAKYRFEYADLDSYHKTIADNIMKAIHSYNGPDTSTRLKNVTEAKNVNDVKNAVHALNETYFPFYGEVGVELYYYHKSSTNNNVVCSLQINPKQTLRDLSQNEKDRKIMKKWYKKCTKKKWSKKKKTEAIAKYIAKKKYYVSGDKYPDDIFRFGSGNCRAMSELYKEMCQEAGISSCRRVSGYLNRRGNAHAWTTLTIGGKRYYTDPTLYRSASKKNKKKYLLVKKLPKKNIFK